jgi:hypothetical protein
MGDELRARRFSQAVEQALSSARQEENWARDAKEAVLSSRAVTALTVAAIATLLLLVLRPPFALRFEHDSRRPWRGSAQVAWRSVAVASALTAGIAFVL